jgi:carboxyl-terminal processing protease
LQFRWILLRWLRAALLFFAVACVSPGLAASGNDPVLSDSSRELRRQAQKKEESGQWLKASELYERILSREHHVADIKERYQDCLRRAQQARRHHDMSYRQQILRLTLQESLQLYCEVLAKLQASYVERDKTDLTLLFQQGLEELRRALSDESFRRLYLPGAGQESIREFQTRLQSAKAGLAMRRMAEIESGARDLASAGQKALGLKPTVVVMELMAGACSGLDEYTYYLTPAQLNELSDFWRGEIVGVGIELTCDDQKLLISQVIPGSPAQANGLKAGDQILRIDNKSAAGLTHEAASELLRGAADTTVELQVASGNTRQRLVKLTRQIISVPSISEPRFLDERLGIAYLQLIAFQETTLLELDLAVAKLQAAGMKVLIVDLRGNAGGLFEVAVHVVERFLSAGVIVFTQGQGSASKFNNTYEAHEINALAIPLIVLVDGETASAAEVVAGALKDNQRGTVVGETTFGKGSIQKVRKLDLVPAGIRVTVAKFYSPHGQPYSGNGVVPHVVVGRPESSLDIDHDPQVQAALDMARPLAMGH